MPVLVAISFEVDTIKVEEVEEVAVLMLTLGFGVEWGDVKQVVRVF